MVQIYDITMPKSSFMSATYATIEANIIWTLIQYEDVVPPV